jgi:hypothetical protein
MSALPDIKVSQAARQQSRVFGEFWKERVRAYRRKHYAVRLGLPEHVASHMKTMAQLHADNRYDRLTHDFEAVIGRPATSIREYVAKHREIFSRLL